MIAGMAIGSLLVSYVGAPTIFLLGGVIAGVTMLYGLMALPSRVSGSEFSETIHSAWRDMRALISNGVFARTVFLVGMPAKAVLTGVMLFAMPILLTKSGYVREDIGQITMLYAGAVIISSHFASIRADREANTHAILFNGATLTALGLALIAGVSFVSPTDSPVIATALIIAGVVIVGIAHGYINAPVVTHITNSPMAGAMGMTSAAAGYRLLERLGHVAGPIILGQVFAIFGASWSVLGAIALAIFILGAIFISSETTDDATRVDDSGEARA
jgi:hypothetical protein